MNSLNDKIPPIRKISIGSPKNGLNYVVGNKTWNNSPYTVHDIKINDLFLEYCKAIVFEVWVSNDDEIFLWKHFFSSMTNVGLDESFSLTGKTDIENVGVTAVEFELMDNEENGITR